MIISGLDIARFTGISLINPAADPSTWRTFCLVLEKEATWVKTAKFSPALREFYQDEDHHADFVVIETPLGIVMDYGAGGAGKPDDKRSINAATVASLNSLAGAAIGVLDGLRIPYGMLQPRSWHTVYFGSGFKPPMVLDKSKKAWVPDWKAASVAHARLQNIPLPVGNRQAQEDCADAVGAAASWRSKAIFVPEHHQQAYMRLVMDCGRVAA